MEDHEHLDRDHRALIAVNRAIAAHTHRDELFAEIASHVSSVLEFDKMALYVPSPDGEGTAMYVIVGGGAQRVPAVQPPDSGSLVQRLFAEPRPFIASSLADLEGYPVARSAMQAMGSSSCLLLPLFESRRVLGVLIFMSKKPGHFDGMAIGRVQQFADAIAVALANCVAREENARLARALGPLSRQKLVERAACSESELIAKSAPMLALLADIRCVAPTDAGVLIQGETGTGKELIACAIHQQSVRSAGPLVKVNCAALNRELVESELFGHVKGAFTGALRDRRGRFELARGGTLFLDEVGELPLDTQAKLLRVIQEGEFEPVGSTETLTTDARVIAATNRDLAAMVDRGQFRADLFYRLNVFPLSVPPLRERPEDIPLLVDALLARLQATFKKPIERVSQRSLDFLRAHPFPGNVRELSNLLERAAVLATSPVLEIEPMPHRLFATEAPERALETPRRGRVAQP
jgi:formate hydrogenlyase transcriptional activator